MGNNRIHVRKKQKALSFCPGATVYGSAGQKVSGNVKRVFVQADRT